MYQPESLLYGECSFSELEGKTIINTKIETDYKTKDQTIIFYAKDGDVYYMGHCQEGSETAWIKDICGELEEIHNKVIIKAEKTTEKGSMTWTFYKIFTHDSCIVITWEGNSNGYYSEEVGFFVDKDLGKYEDIPNSIIMLLLFKSYNHQLEKIDFQKNVKNWESVLKEMMESGCVKKEYIGYKKFVYVMTKSGEEHLENYMKNFSIHKDKEGVSHVEVH